MDKLGKEAIKSRKYRKIGKDILCHSKVLTNTNNIYPKSSKFNKATNHEVTKQNAKIAKEAIVTIWQMLNCSRLSKSRCDHRSRDCDLSNRKLRPKSVFGASTGLEPMASVMALQCSTI